MRYHQIVEQAIAANDYPLRAKFNLYNGKCFGGELPELPLSFARLKGQGGVCTCQYTRPNQGLNRAARMKGAVLVPGSIAIKLDKTYLRDEQSIDAILIHEMIHAWLFLQNEFMDNHGLAFLTKRKQCSSIVGFQIPITEKIENAVMADIPVQKLVVFVLRSRDQTGFAIVSPTTFARMGETIGREWQQRNFYADVQFTAYEIATPLWSQKAQQMKVQRPSSYRAMRFFIPNEEAMDDLMTNGRVLLDLHRS